jgi:hypothetical protein
VHLEFARTGAGGGASFGVMWATGEDFRLAQQLTVLAGVLNQLWVEGVCARACLLELC